MAEDTPQWPLAGGTLQAPPNSITTDRGLTNQQLAQLASDLPSQSDDTNAGLTAILNAILAKPSA